MFPIRFGNEILTVWHDLQGKLVQNGTSPEFISNWTQYRCAKDKVVLVESFLGDKPFLTEDDSSVDLGKAELNAIIALLLKTLSTMVPVGPQQQLDYFSIVAMSMQDKLEVNGGCFKYKDDFGYGISELVPQVYAFSCLDWLLMRMFAVARWPLELGFSWVVGGSGPNPLYPYCQKDDACKNMCNDQPDSCDGGAFRACLDVLTYSFSLPGAGSLTSKSGASVLGVVTGIISFAGCTVPVCGVVNGQIALGAGVVPIVCWALGGILWLIPKALFGVAFDLFGAINAFVGGIFLIVIIMLLLLAATALATFFFCVCYVLSWIGLLEILGLLPFFSTLLNGFYSASAIKKMNAAWQLRRGIAHIVTKLSPIYRACKRRSHHAASPQCANDPEGPDSQPLRDVERVGLCPPEALEGTLLAS